MKSRKIAIIDEDKEMLGELNEILNMGGYSSILINDPLSALDTVFENKPDVVLMELRMPQKNGFELTHEINRVFETKRMPVIAMSENFKDEFRWLLEICGIKRCIKKPFHPLDIIWAIENEIEEDYQIGRTNRLEDIGITV